MTDLFHVGHVAELHAIQRARLSRGERGIGPEIEELIRRLTSGGVAGKFDEPRIMQAKRYFDLGVGRELDIESFMAYFEAIPPIPEALLAEDPRFPYLVLVEPRIGLSRLCRLGSIIFNGDDSTFVPWSDEYKDPTSPVWIRMQDGRRNRDRAVHICRSSFAPDELGLIALEGVCSYLQHPSVVTDFTDPDVGHTMDLPGSVRRDDRENAAYFRVRDGRAALSWYWDDSISPRYGSASRRR